MTRRHDLAESDGAASTIAAGVPCDIAGHQSAGVPRGRRRGPGWSSSSGQRASAQPSPDGPYGALAAQPDANGLLLPEGFTSRVMARSGEPVGGHGLRVAGLPGRRGDVPAPTTAAGIHVVNSEIPVEGDGGGSAIQYDADGDIATPTGSSAAPRRTAPAGPRRGAPGSPARRSTRARSGSATRPRRAAARALPAMGPFHHEAAAVDPDGERVYLTEDEPDGAFYRFTPDAYPDLSAGLARGRLGRRRRRGHLARGARPVGGGEPTALQVPEATAFNGGEGFWYADGIVYFTTKGDNQVRRSTPPPTPSSRLRRHRPAAGRRQHHRRAGLRRPLRRRGRRRHAAGRHHRRGRRRPVRPGRRRAPARPTRRPSEITGPVFSPDGTRLYFSSQRGGDPQTGDHLRGHRPVPRHAAEEPAHDHDRGRGEQHHASASRPRPTTTRAAAHPPSRSASRSGSRVVAGAVAIRRRRT